MILFVFPRTFVHWPAAVLQNLFQENQGTVEHADGIKVMIQTGKPWAPEPEE